MNNKVVQKAVLKAVLICVLHQGDFIVDTQNRTLTMLMLEVCNAACVTIPAFHGCHFEWNRDRAFAARYSGKQVAGTQRSFEMANRSWRLRARSR